MVDLLVSSLDAVLLYIFVSRLGQFCNMPEHFNYAKGYITRATRVEHAIYSVSTDPEQESPIARLSPFTKFSAPITMPRCATRSSYHIQSICVVYFQQSYRAYCVPYGCLLATLRTGLTNADAYSLFTWNK